MGWEYTCTLFTVTTASTALVRSGVGVGVVCASSVSADAAQ